MTRKAIILAAAALAALAPGAGVARPNSAPAAPPQVDEEEAEPVEVEAPPPPGIDAADEDDSETAAIAVPSETAAAPEPVVTATTAEPAATAPVNPYANSYNELLPLDPEFTEEEETAGFDDWGLLGLIGLLGLFGLKRRDRVVYAERVDRDG